MFSSIESISNISKEHKHQTFNCTFSKFTEINKKENEKKNELCDFLGKSWIT